jgi:general nucleoside transport system permease protein
MTAERGHVDPTSEASTTVGRGAVQPAGEPRLGAHAIASSAERSVRGLLPLVVTLAVGAVVLAATGRNPGSVYHLYLIQAVGTWPRAANTLAAATPLMLTGVGTALAFRAGFFNVGLEGAVYLGALATAWAAATWTWLPGSLMAPASLLLGLAAGAAWLVVPALLRAYLAIDEVVTTLMLNYVGIALTSYIVLYHFLYQTIGNAQTPPVASAARLQSLTTGTTLTVAAPVAVAILLAYGFFLRRTRLGTEVRMVGDNPRFAAAVGFSVRRAALLTMIVGGALGGLAGGFIVLGVTQNFTAGFSTGPGFGYTGIAVAVLGRNSWLGLFLASLFFGALASAGGVIQLFGNVPIALTQILQGTLMIFAGARYVGVRRRRRTTVAGGPAEPTGLQVEGSV